MERSIFAALIGGLLGITTLGGLAFVGSAPGSPAAPSSRPEGDWRLLNPVTYENISVFPVVSSYSQDASTFLTLEEGLATGDVAVHEQGSESMVRGRDGHPVYIPQPGTGASVNQLVLINRSKRPLLLLAGELVSGGKQDRVIGKDRIVPAGAPPLPLDVCSASSTAVGPAARNLQPQKPSSIPASAKAPPLIRPRQKSGTPYATARTRKPPQPPLALKYQSTISKAPSPATGAPKPTKKFMSRVPSAYRSMNLSSKCSAVSRKLHQV